MQVHPCHHRSAAPLVAVALLALSVSLPAQTNRIDPERFGTYACYPCGPLLGRFVVADLNGDGRLDVVAESATQSAFELQVLLNTGGRSFGTPQHITLPLPVMGLAVGDLDGDGDQDLIVGAQPYGGNSIYVLRNNGNATFGAPVSYPGGSSPRAVALGDVDADGDLDAIIGSNQAPLRIAFNNGTAGFATGTSLAGTTGVQEVYVADLDRDGRLDILAVVANQVLVLRATGPGTFAAPTALATPGTGQFLSERSLGIGDLDGDGFLDLAVYRHYLSFTLAVFHNNGSGQLLPVTTVQPYNGAPAPRIADLDGDGLGEIVTTGLDVWQLSGSALNQVRHFDSGEYPIDQWIGDLDGDGFKELLLMTYAGLEVRQFTEHGVPRGPVAFATAGSGYYASAKDLDGDGLPDIVRGASPMVAHRNLGNGAFGPPITVGSVVEHSPIVDINNDGLADVVTPNGVPFSRTIRVHPGVPGFGFGPQLTVTYPPALICETGQLAVGDLDGDGNPDLVVGCSPENGCSVTQDRSFLVMRGDGAGGFNNAVRFTGGYAGPVEPVLADLDADGDLDLAIAHRFFDMAAGNISRIQIWKNNGLGAFTFFQLLGVPAEQRELVAADLDNDGDVDLAALSAGNNNGLEPAVSVLRNTGNGSFTATVSYPTRRDSRPLLAGEAGLRVADLDGDGRPDLCFSTLWGGASIGVLKNLGQAQFGPMSETGAAMQINLTFGHGAAEGLGVADFDGDGYMDLVTACNLPPMSGGNAGVMVLWNHWVPEPDPALVADSSTISASAGGSVGFDVNLAPSLGGGIYLGLIGVSGESPGFDVGQGHLFLNWDAFTSAFLPAAGGPLLQGFLGVLSGTGDGHGDLVLPPGVAVPVIGARVTVAFVGFGASVAFTNPTSVRITP